MNYLTLTVLIIYIQSHFTISILYPLGEGCSPPFQQNWINTQECFLPSLVETDPVVLKRKIFKVFDIILILLLLFPLGKGWGPSFEKKKKKKHESTTPKDALCHVSLKLTQLKMWKVDRQTDRQTTVKNWSAKLTWAFRSGDLKMWMLPLFIQASFMVYRNLQYFQYLLLILTFTR